MAKKKKTEVPNNLGFIITAALIKDGFCNYSYDITDGTGAGDTHNVKGRGIIDPDMEEAFVAMNVHLACIDDVFKHGKVKINDINDLVNHDLTALYNVTGFKIKGGGESETIVITGTKSVTASGGRIELETPKIPLDNLSSYPWWEELKAASDKARYEVELYKQGKCTAVETSDDPNQLTIGDAIADFENAEVK